MAIGLHITIPAKDAQIIMAHLMPPEPWEERAARIDYNALMRRLDVDGGFVIIHPDEARIIQKRIHYEWDDLDAQRLWKWRETLILFLGRCEMKEIYDRAKKPGVANG